MRSYTYSAAVAAFVVLLFSAGVAQTTLGHIRGVVQDSQGQVLAGVEVALASADGTFQRRSLSNQRGEFVFAGLRPGRYSIAASMAGVGVEHATVSVEAGRTARLTIALSAASVDETVAAKQRADRTRRSIAPYPASPPSSMSGFGLRSAYAATPFNTEAYDRVEDNAWNQVVHKALSTFSIDVDTASYANVRRFLNRGQLPPKDAVRIEELINYFAFDYPQPDGEQPFSVTTAVGECAWNPKHRLALIGLQARRVDSSRLPPRNLVFLIDVSGSMATPQKLPLVKASLAMLARNLTERDRLAIVVYAGAAGLVLPSTPGSDTEAILEALGRLEAGGSTNGADGIVLAYRTARTHFIKEGVNRVILATDGDFNVGVTNQGDLTRLVEQQRQGGVHLSVLGFGMGNLKDSTLEKLADKGDGNYSYIDTLEEAEKVLVTEAGATLVTVAKDVKLQVEFNPKTVGAYRLVGYENRMLQDRDFNDDKKDAGDMGAGHSVTALYELIPAGQPLDIPGVDPLKYQRPPTLTSAATSGELMTVKLRYKQPDGETSALASTTVADRVSPSAALGFATAVAEFGMLLRDSEHRGTATFASAADLARRHKGPDAHGHRAEFIRLIEVAHALSHTRQTTQHDR